MTELEQRVAIAEACGKDADYLHDLDAMHEAEKVLADDQWAAIETGYTDQLIKIVQRTEPLFLRYVVRATAAQRAEAFLRAIGKWKQ